MIVIKRLILVVVVFLLVSGYGFDRIDYRDGMYKIVCKDLRNNVLVYFIFVDR